MPLSPYNFIINDSNDFTIDLNDNTIDIFATGEYQSSKPEQKPERLLG